MAMSCPSRLNQVQDRQVGDIVLLEHNVGHRPRALGIEALAGREKRIFPQSAICTTQAARLTKHDPRGCVPTRFGPITAPSIDGAPAGTLRGHVWPYGKHIQIPHSLRSDRLGWSLQRGSGHANKSHVGKPHHG